MLKEEQLFWHSGLRALTWRAPRGLGTIRQISGSLRLSGHVFFIGVLDIVFAHLTSREVKIKTICWRVLQ